MQEVAEAAKAARARESAFLFAAAAGDVAALDALLSSDGVDAACRDGKGRTALHCAACRGHAEALAFLLARGADGDAEDAEGRTPLHVAAAAAQPACVDVLIGGGGGGGGQRKAVWVDATDASDDTPLSLAAAARCGEAVRSLLAAGAAPTERALSRAVAADAPEALSALMAAHPPPLAAVRPKGRSLLHLAAATGSARCARLLLGAGGLSVSDDGGPDDGAWAAHVAAASKHAHMLALLLGWPGGKAGRARDSRGRTPADVLYEAKPPDEGVSSGSRSDSANPVEAAKAAEAAAAEREDWEACAAALRSAGALVRGAGASKSGADSGAAASSAAPLAGTAEPDATLAAAKRFASLPLPAQRAALEKLADVLLLPPAPTPAPAAAGTPAPTPSPSASPSSETFVAAGLHPLAPAAAAPLRDAAALRRAAALSEVTLRFLEDDAWQAAMRDPAIRTGVEEVSRDAAAVRRYEGRGDVLGACAPLRRLQAFAKPRGITTTLASLLVGGGNSAAACEERLGRERAAAANALKAARAAVIAHAAAAAAGGNAAAAPAAPPPRPPARAGAEGGLGDKPCGVASAPALPPPPVAGAAAPLAQQQRAGAAAAAPLAAASAVADELPRSLDARFFLRRFAFALLRNALAAAVTFCLLWATGMLPAQRAARAQLSSAAAAQRGGLVFDDDDL